jgi:hypothetical protein
MIPSSRYAFWWCLVSILWMPLLFFKTLVRSHPGWTLIWLPLAGSLAAVMGLADAIPALRTGSPNRPLAWAALALGLVSVLGAVGLLAVVLVMYALD